MAPAYRYNQFQAHPSTHRLVNARCKRAGMLHSKLARSVHNRCPCVYLSCPLGPSLLLHPPSNCQSLVACAFACTNGTINAAPEPSTQTTVDVPILPCGNEQGRVVCLLVAHRTASQVGPGSSEECQWHLVLSQLMTAVEQRVAQVLVPPPSSCRKGTPTPKQHQGYRPSPPVEAAAKKKRSCRARRGKFPALAGSGALAWRYPI